MLKYLKPPGYNPPHRWEVLWNQWLHQGYLWGWWSYEYYDKHSIYWDDRS